MKVMLLAAGRGERLRPLTDDTPKPLLEVGGRPLVEHLITALVAAGFSELVVNCAWHKQQIMDALGDGSQFRASIQYSPESSPLETGGGIVQAMPYLGDEPFLAINTDIWTDYPFARLREQVLLMRERNAALIHLVMVDNPIHHPDGDYQLCDGRLVFSATERLTFAGIGIYDPRAFVHPRPARFALAELFEEMIEQGHASGEHYRGGWRDIGTVDRLRALDAMLREKP